MKNHVCEEKMHIYLSLDKHQMLPFSLIVHMLSCSKCRTEVRLLTLAEKNAAKPFAAAQPLSSEAVMRIMQHIDADFAQKNPSLRPVTLKRWVYSGLAMILALISFRWFTQSMMQNSSLMFAFYLLFGCIVAVYGALFIGSNMDFFVKKITTCFNAAHVRA